MLVMSLMSSPVTADARTVLASWYKYGTVTANGERFNPDGLTAAHKKFPFGTILLLTHGTRSTIVRINDRGPHIKGRELDLSKGAAEALGCIDMGTCRVNMKIVKLAK